MSVRTAEELSDSIAEDLIWRKKELTALKGMLQRAGPDGKNVLLRSLIALLYAHWEGFVQNTSRRYLEYLSHRRMPYQELGSNFVALSLRRRFAEAAAEHNLQSLIDLVEFVRSGLAERSRIPHKDGINTQSNLSSDVLRQITTSLGLAFTAFESKALLLDERLLASRNRIAHGEYLLVDEAGALELATEVQAMMEHYRSIVENAVALAGYRRAKSANGNVV